MHINKHLGKITQDKDGNTELTSQSARRVQFTLNDGLVGWRNFPGKDGEDLEFKVQNPGKDGHAGTRILNPDTINCIPSKYRYELADAIALGTAPTGEDEEKSGPASA